MIFYLFLFFNPISIQSDIISNEEDKENTIYITSNVNEIFASTKISQFFINHLESPIELSITFPIKEEITLSKFLIKIDDKDILSKIMPKDIAEKKYKEALEEGKTGFITRYDEDSNYIVKLGNINPKQKVILNTYFIQMIGSHDMSYEFVIMEKYPTFHYKELNQNKNRNKKIKANFIIETQSKITRIIAPFYDEEAKKSSKYEVTLDKELKKANIIYEKNPDFQPNFDEFEGFGQERGYPGLVNRPTFLTSFSILFRTERMYKPTLYYQYNHDLGEIAYSINYVYSSKELKNIPIPEKPDQDNTISYYSKYEENIINETPGLFIFLIDQSGSMRGQSIELVRQALILFIKSLPQGSYFQFIGFGSSYKKYNNIPVEYNEENVNNIINIILKIEADMGGTNIGSPLNDIYKDDYYTNIKLSKNILVLTDGQVNNRDECVNLITANSNKFRIHAIGIGDLFDKILIERSGKLGKGSSNFVEDIEKINAVVINTLNKCLRPYLIDIDFAFKNNVIQNSIVISEPMNNFAYQDEIINYSFILKEENKISIDNFLETFTIEITGKNPTNVINEKISFYKSENIIRLKNGDELGKIIVGKALKYNKELINDRNKEIEFSQKYQVLSKNTALYEEIINDKNNLNKNELIEVNLNDYHSNFDLDRHVLLFSRPMNAMRTHRILSTDTFSSFEAGQFDQSCNLNSLNLIDNRIGEKFEKNEKKQKDSGIDVNQLIMNQDVIEGFWNENKFTKDLIKYISEDKYKKINDRIKKKNKVNQEMKIKYTVLVIYYLNTNYSDKINEYKFIINKAKKYLINQGIKYDDIIEGI